MGINEFFSSIFTTNFLAMTLRLSTPILLASMASFVASTTGISNTAIESIMTLSALFGILGSYWSQSAIVGILVGIAMGILVSLIIAFFSMKLGASVSLIGIALNTFSGPLAIFFLYQFTGNKGTSASLASPTIGNWDIPFIKDIPVLGEIISGHYILTYVSWLLAIILFIIIFKTPLGMRMRAIGLSESTAETAGVNVNKLRLLSIILSGILAALGGTFLSLNYSKIFSSNMVSGQGWMGIAASGIARGSYPALMIATFAFSIFRAISVVFIGTDFPSELITAVPYIAVFVGISAIAIIETYKRKKGNVAEK